MSKLRTTGVSDKSANSWQSSTIGGGRSGGRPPQGSKRSQQDPDKPWAIEMRESFEVTHSVNPTSTDELHRKVDDEEAVRGQRNNSMRNNEIQKSDPINQIHISDDDVSITHETLTKYPY
jgi:hypothetical protein